AIGEPTRTGVVTHGRSLTGRRRVLRAAARRGGGRSGPRAGYRGRRTGGPGVGGPPSGPRRGALGLFATVPAAPQRVLAALLGGRGRLGAVDHVRSRSRKEPRSEERRVGRDCIYPSTAR